MQEICRIGQDFLHINFLFICMKCCPILCSILCVENVRKCHVLENRTCRKFYFWSSVTYKYYANSALNNIKVCQMKYTRNLYCGIVWTYKIKFPLKKCSQQHLWPQLLDCMLDHKADRTWFH